MKSLLSEQLLHVESTDCAETQCLNRRFTQISRIALICQERNFTVQTQQIEKFFTKAVSGLSRSAEIVFLHGCTVRFRYAKIQFLHSVFQN